MNNALADIVHALFNLACFLFLARFLLQASRADFYNPVSQGIVKMTDPILRPLRLVIKGFSMPFEGHKLEFRAEFFNVINRVNLGNPNTTLTNALFGRITSAGDPRIIQLGLRYAF